MNMIEDCDSIKHGFILALYFLNVAATRSDLHSFYEESIAQTVQLGGNTSANAAIVGALIGGLVGVNALPLKSLNRLMKFDCTSQANIYEDGPRHRPAFLSVKSHAVSLIE